MNRYQKAIKYTKPSTEIDEKISRLNEMMKTTGMYCKVDQTDGVEVVAPTYGPAPLGDYDPDNFSWPDQGDGSDADANPVTTGLTVTDTLGREISTFDYLPGVTYSGWDRQPDYSLYPDGKPPMAILYDGRALASTRYFVLNEDGLNFVVQIGAYTTPGPYTDLQTEIYNWVSNGDKSNLTTKTIYIWGPLQTLVGGWYGAGQYYPPDRSNTSDPKADRALYAYTMYVPATGNLNYASDPGVRAQPPKVTNVLSRDNLGDPNYYAGPINFLMNLGQSISDFGQGLIDFLSGLGSNLPPLVPAVTDFFSGIDDGLNLLGDVLDTWQTAKLEGNIEPPENPGDRPTITEGKPGSSTNPIQTNLSDSSMNTLQDAANNYNPMDDGDPDKSLEENLLNYYNDFTSTSDNLGLKATHNNIQGVEIDGDDIILKDTYGYGPSEDIYEKPLVKQVSDTAEVIYDIVGLDGKEASKNVQTFFDQLGPAGAVAAHVVSKDQSGPTWSKTNPGLPGKDDPVVHFETRIEGGAKNLGSNSKPINEETLFEKWKKKDQKKSESKPSQLQQIYDYFYNLPKSVKKMIAMDIKVEVEIMMLPPDQKSFREKELRNTLVNKHHEIYMDEKFPENKEQTSRVKKILARNIELSDPKTFKDPKPALTYGKVFGDDPKNKRVKEKDFRKKSPARFFKTEKKKDTSRTRWLKG